MIALFVMKLSAGITLMWLLMPCRDVTDGFFRIQMRLVLGTTVLAALLLSRTTTWSAIPSDLFAQTTAAQLRWLQIAAAVVAYPGSVFWALGRRRPGNLCIWLMGLLCCGAVLWHSWSVPGEGGRMLQVLSDAASCSVIGATLTAMLLGHWYLTTPTMSINPLWWFNRTLLIAGIFRLGVSSAAITKFLLAGPVGANWDTTRWLWLASRIVGGCLVPIVVSILVWRILKYRNTQSATGVYFAGLILVFMGEMTALLLERDVKIPF